MYLIKITSTSMSLMHYSFQNLQVEVRQVDPFICSDEIPISATFQLERQLKITLCSFFM